jgi:hypothetical protein
MNPRVSLLLREGAENALATFQRSSTKKAWVDQLIAPLFGLVVVLGAIGGAIVSRRAANRALLPGQRNAADRQDERF